MYGKLSSDLFMKRASDNDLEDSQPQYKQKNIGEKGCIQNCRRLVGTPTGAVRRGRCPHQPPSDRPCENLGCTRGEKYLIKLLNMCSSKIPDTVKCETKLFRILLCLDQLFFQSIPDLHQ